MKFSIRDLTWLIVMCLVAVAGALCGFWLGDLRLSDQNSRLNYELVTARIRVQELENDLKKAGNKQNIDAIVKLEKLTENEDKFIATRYRLELIEPVPLRQLLESDIVPSILAIGATVKFQILSAEEAKKWDAKFKASPAIVVTATKGEFTFKDEIVFTVYFPAAAS